MEMKWLLRRAPCKQQYMLGLCGCHKLLQDTEENCIGHTCIPISHGMCYLLSATSTSLRALLELLPVPLRAIQCYLRGFFCFHVC